MAEEEITIKDLFGKVKALNAYLRSQWRTIIIVCFIGGGIGLVYALQSTKMYVAETTFVLQEESSSSGLGQYAGLASMVGVNLGGGGGGVFAADNLLEWYKSRKMIGNALLSKVIIDHKEQFLIDRYLDFKNVRRSWKNLALQRLNFNDTLNSRLKDSVISEVVVMINNRILKIEKPDKQSGIIKVQITSNDEQFAKLFSNQLVKNVNDFYIQTKTKKSMDNLKILQHQTDSVRKDLNHAISGVAEALDVNPNPNASRQVLRVPSQKKQVDVQANTAILSELVKNLEISKVSLRKETPLIQVIDEPVYPLKTKIIGKINAILIGAFAFGFLSILYLVIKKGFSYILR